MKRASSWNPALTAAAAIWLLVAAAIKIYLVVHQKINEGEFLHLQFAWAMTQGMVPNRDFMLMHMPLPHYLLSPLFFVFHDSVNIIFAARALCVLCSAGALFFMFLTTRELFGRAAALFALLCAPLVVVYMEKSTEVRPDQLAALFGMASLWLLARENPRAWPAGLFAGLAIVANHKFLFMGLFLGLGIIFFSSREWLERIKNAARFATVAAGPIAVFLAYLLLTGTFGRFFFYQYRTYQMAGCAGGQAGFSLHATRLPFLMEGILQSPTFFLAAAAGLLLCLGAWSAHSAHVRMPLMYLAGILTLIFSTSIHDKQVNLYLVPALAPFAGHAAARLTGRFARKLSSAGRVAATLVLSIILVAPSLASMGPLLKEDNAQQISTWEWILRTVPPGEGVMDGHAGMFVYRKNDFYYFTLAFEDTKEVFRSFFDSDDQLADIVIGSLEKNHTRLVLLEDVFEAVLPARAVQYIKDNFQRVDGRPVPIYVRP